MNDPAIVTAYNQADSRESPNDALFGSAQAFQVAAGTCGD